MTAGAKVVSYKSLAEGWGANITEVGERLAAKRPSGIAELGEAKADFGQGLDIYQFEFQGEKLSELWLIALVQKGSENVLCNIACRTPRLLWDTKKDQFNSIMESFKPLQPVAAPAPAAAS
uniref:PsbP C-terminal domain-containing protein n=1 Tax=Alexandrium andersonii TaxID=327968 RepID=A0A7S2FF40_9DINO|mmetsp:Transcript_2308/g.5160  ORF Transcript_2308/g.5160 Transcript_2308/m.5160 type:complete len:121 (+) Transcript_2308:423-785(+)